VALRVHAPPDRWPVSNGRGVPAIAPCNQRPQAPGNRFAARAQFRWQFGPRTLNHFCITATGRASSGLFHGSRHRVDRRARVWEIQPRRAITSRLPGKNLARHRRQLTKGGFEAFFQQNVDLRKRGNSASVSEEDRQEQAHTSASRDRSLAASALTPLAACFRQATSARAQTERRSSARALSPRQRREQT